MIFEQFMLIMQKHVKKMFDEASELYRVDIDGITIWETYLESFPPGTNEVYRKAREFECSCCLHFVKHFGNVVTIKDNKIVSIWDFDPEDSTFTPVVKAISEVIHTYGAIKERYFTNKNSFGTEQSFESLPNGAKEWDHFYVRIPSHLVSHRLENKDISGEIAEYTNQRTAFKNSLAAIGTDAIGTVLELIDQNSIYRGNEWEAPLRKFQDAQNAYNALPKDEKENFCWVTPAKVGPVASKLKNHSIGTLLLDISGGMELEAALRRYENVVAPANYKRPKPVFSNRMKEEAKKTATEHGFITALERRYATIDDIRRNNILYGSGKALVEMNAFDQLTPTKTIDPKNYDRVEVIPIQKFVDDILPNLRSFRVLFESRHFGNLVSLTAPANADSVSMFKWENRFAWAYAGNMTDSMKQNVKNAGGKTDGPLRFSIQWNDNHDNHNDFDAHCYEPKGKHIYFGNKHNRITTGDLDVDIIDPRSVAVENITWTDINKMDSGLYKFSVHNFSQRDGRNGFSAEVEFSGQVYHFEYRNPIANKETINVATVKFAKATKTFELVDSLDTTLSNSSQWGLTTNQFYPVSVAMLSPNHWDGEKGIGNKHFFFFIDDCVNDTRPNGFYNEFLNQDLNKHRKVFEALGSMMKVENSERQLSGIGFSDTQRNSIICEVEGYTKRIIKLTF